MRVIETKEIERIPAKVMLDAQTELIIIACLSILVFIALLLVGLAFNRLMAKRRQLENLLQVSETEYRQLVEHLPDPSIIELSGKIVYVNTEAVKLFGASSQYDLIGESVQNLVHPNHQSLVEAHICHVRDGCKPSDRLESQVVKLNGEAVEVEVTAIPTNYSGNVASLLVLRDISDRKQAEKIAENHAIRFGLFLAVQQEIADLGLDLDPIMQIITERTQEITDANGAVIALIEGSEEVYRAVSGMMSGYLGLRIPITKDLTDQCMRMGKLWYCEDITQENYVSLEIYKNAGVVSIVIVPLERYQQTVGILKVVSTERSAFDRWDLMTLQLITRLVTNAISNAADYEAKQDLVAERTAALSALKQSEAKLRQRAKRDQALNRAVQAIRNSLDLNTIFSTAAGETARLLQADRVKIVQYLPEQKIWLVVANYLQSPDSGSLDLEISDEGNEITARLKLLEIVRVDDASTLEGMPNPSLVENFPASWLLIPLHFSLGSSSGRSQPVWGCLCLIRNGSLMPWQAPEEELACAIADQLIIAIQQSELYQKVDRMAHLDGLTQIANRRSFDAYFEREWTRMIREQADLSLVMCDVDFFKPFNDHYGHPAGDFCLQQIAQVLLQTIRRPADLVARYGGEEFVVILPNTSMLGAIKVAERIRTGVKALQIEHKYSKAGEYITLSCGIATIVPARESQPSLLLAAADQALYQAKQTGRDRICIQDSQDISV